MTARLAASARAGLFYFAIIFACGFLLGTVRTLLLLPAFGPLVAVALELPVMLGLAWIVAGRLTRGRAALADAAARLSMGGIALALLMVAEFALAIAGVGQAPSAYAASLLTPHGLLGFAGQALFGLLPWLRRKSGKG